jgi:hypothetical protein
MPVDHLKLGLTLETKDKGVLCLSVLGDRSVKLWETLQTRQLVQDKPDRMLALFRLIQETEHKQVDP